MRFDNHDAIDSIIGDTFWSIYPTNFEVRQQTGQKLIIQSRPAPQLCKGITSRDLIWGRDGGFLKSIQEVLPEKPSIFNESTFNTEWTMDIAEAMQFNETESCRYLSNAGFAVSVFALRLPYSSSRPPGWLGSIEQFPAQKKLDEFLAIKTVEPVRS